MKSLCVRLFFFFLLACVAARIIAACFRGASLRFLISLYRHHQPPAIVMIIVTIPSCSSYILPPPFFHRATPQSPSCSSSVRLLRSDSLAGFSSPHRLPHRHAIFSPFPRRSFERPGAFLLSLAAPASQRDRIIPADEEEEDEEGGRGFFTWT